MGHNCERISFNTQPPEGGWMQAQTLISNPCGFNTQPPEGGWGSLFASIGLLSCFNTQPPEGGWKRYLNKHFRVVKVSTHSRPKAAG